MSDTFGTRVPQIGRAQIAPASPTVVIGTAAQTIHFPSQFNGYAIDVVIDNLDAVGTLTLRINSTSGGALGGTGIVTLSPSGALTITDAKVIVIQIVTGTNYQIIFNIVPLPKGI